MSNHPPPDDPTMDESLAEFTDRLLAQDKSIAPEAQDPELRDLEETVVRLKQVITDIEPDPQMASNIKGRLLDEWKKIHRFTSAPQPAANQRRTWLDYLNELKWRFAARPRSLALGFAAIAAAALLAILLLSPTTPGGLMGTAGGSGAYSGLLIALAVFILLALLALWISRRH